MLMDERQANLRRPRCAKNLGALLANDLTMMPPAGKGAIFKSLWPIARRGPSH